MEQVLDLSFDRLLMMMMMGVWKQQLENIVEDVETTVKRVLPSNT